MIGGGWIRLLWLRLGGCGDDVVGEGVGWCV